MTTNKSKLVRIASNERVSGAANNFTVAIGTTIPRPYAIALKSVNFTNSFYNINTTDNKFAMGSTQGASDYGTITIPPGFYSVEQLCSAIASSWNATAPAVTITDIDTSEGKQTVILNTQSTNYDRLLRFTLSGNASISGTILTRLGFATATAVSSTITADYMPSLSGLSQFVIRLTSGGICTSNLITPSTAGGSRDEPGLYVVDVTAAYGQRQVIDYDDMKSTLITYDQHNRPNISRLSVSLHTRNGALIETQNQNFKLVLKLWY